MPRDWDHEAWPQRSEGTCQKGMSDFFRTLVQVYLLQSDCTRRLQYPKQSVVRLTGSRRNMLSSATVTQQITVVSSVKGSLRRLTSQIVWTLSPRAERLDSNIRYWNWVSAWPHQLEYPNDLDAVSRAERHKNALTKSQNDISESPARKTDAVVQRRAIVRTTFHTLHMPPSHNDSDTSNQNGCLHRQSFPPSSLRLFPAFPQYVITVRVRACVQVF